MQATTASRTSLATALMRSLHTRTDPQRILDDPWGERLVPDAVRDGIALLARASSAGAAAEQGAPQALVDAWLRASVAYPNVVLRSRYAEDALHAAVARGVRQYVLIGAGFDSYALRVPPAARHLRIFEVDHPATQALKRERIAACGAAPAEGLHFLAADLASQSLSSVLAQSTFSADEPAFFSWLGVTMYLTREANLATLAAVSEAAMAGSEIVFSYGHRDAGATPTAAQIALRDRVAALGEPFLSSFDPASLGADLREVGFELEEDLDDTELLARYDPRGVNGMSAFKSSRCARARVAGLVA